MGDPDAPPLRARQIVELLHQHGVDYVVVGGLAAVAHGAGRATFDIDLVPAWTPANLERLGDALRQVEARLRVPDAEPVEYPTTGSVLARFEVSTWRTTLGDIDIIRGTPADRRGALVGFEELASRASRRTAFGIPILVADIGDVIHAKEVLAREPDLAALPELHRLRDRLMADQQGR